MGTETYEVRGMSCEHCVRAVQGEVALLPGVQQVEVELATGRVTVTSDAPLALAAVRGAVEEAGYELVEPS